MKVLEMDRAATVARAKQEILQDIADGTVPLLVRSFGELHDHVDANGYGGFFEAEFADSEHGLIDEEISFFNEVQNEVHAWLVERYPLALRATLLTEFGRALMVVANTTDPGSDAVLDATADAFNTAENYAGWMYQDDEEWFSWQLKATPEEIIIEGLKRALARLEQS